MSVLRCYRCHDTFSKSAEPDVCRCGSVAFYRSPWPTRSLLAIGRSVRRRKKQRREGK